MKYDAIVVGGGAAGLIAGGTMAKEGLNVLVAEKMKRPARKILVTGKGRCNLTNNCDRETFIKNIVSNPKFIYSSYFLFSSQDTMRLFENLGIPVKTERGNRVFPVSEKARDIADGLFNYHSKNGGKLAQIEVSSLLIEDCQCQGIKAVDGSIYYADHVIIATGGKSYPGTGSTGDGYKFAYQSGHTVVKPRPSLVPIETNQLWVAKTGNLALKNITLSLFEKGRKKPLYSQLGELEFTNVGITGPLALSSSAYMKKDLDNYTLSIDLKPGLNHEKLDARILRDFSEIPNKEYDQGLFKLLPQGIIPQIIKESGIPRGTVIGKITKEMRGNLVNLLKNLVLTPKSLGDIKEAVVTAGGVAVKEIEPKTMESKLVKGLYFVGEVLDIDAFTGGFNLQFAFTTGFCGATAIIKEVKEKNI